MNKRPNIVLIVNDHQAYYRHGWDGGPRPLTPNFDRLAAGGVRFKRSYCAVPLCGPSRRTLSTGLYPHNHRNFYNYSNSPYDHEIYLNNLARAGYSCFYLGKWHAGAGTALDFNCEGFSLEDYGNPYITAEYRDYLRKNSLPPAEHQVEYVFDSFVMNREFPQLKVGAPYRSDRYWCGEHATGITTTPKESHEAFFLADMACEQLEALATADNDRPFHLRLDFWGPHQPFFPTKEFADLYEPEDIPVYGSFIDALDGKPDLYWHDPHDNLTDANGRFATPSNLNWGEWQRIIARAYAHITMVDAAGGLVLDKLDELGLSENTLVIWTADHGDALASHGGRFDKGSYLTEEVLRVPLAMRYPGKIPAGHKSNTLTCGTDIAPTVLDAAGTKFERPVDGESLLPLATGGDFSERSSLLVETYGHGFGTIELGRAVVKDQYKLIAYQNYGSELYDLEADPYELVNLYQHSEYRNAVLELEAELQEWLRKTGDRDFNTPISEDFRAEDNQKLRELMQRRANVNHAIE
ncbi:MAG: sulfatase-like hydrolase/transferase [Chloroflexi bacterium]|nr:sulfatase-like hydrolase/transferase [Chloroflexota bacterium]